MRDFDKYLKDSLSDPELAKNFEEISDDVDFGLNLASRREELGITQIQVAQMTGIKQPMLARIERGQTPKVATIQKLAKALEMQVMISGNGIRLVPRLDAMDETAVEEIHVTAISKWIGVAAESLQSEGKIPLSNVVDFEEFKNERQPITEAEISGYTEDEETHESFKSRIG